MACYNCPGPLLQLFPTRGSINKGAQSTCKFCFVPRQNKNHYNCTQPPLLISSRHVCWYSIFCCCWHFSYSHITTKGKSISYFNSREEYKIIVWQRFWFNNEYTHKILKYRYMYSTENYKTVTWQSTTKTSNHFHSHHNHCSGADCFSVAQATMKHLRQWTNSSIETPPR